MRYTDCTREGLHAVLIEPIDGKGTVNRPALAHEHGDVRMRGGRARRAMAGLKLWVGHRTHVDLTGRTGAQTRFEPRDLVGTGGLHHEVADTGPHQIEARQKQRQAVSPKGSTLR